MIMDIVGYMFDMPYFCHQAIAEDPNDAVQWHQLGVHSLCARQFKTSQRYLKAAVACDKDCSYAWSNLGMLYLSHIFYFNACLWYCHV